MGINEKIVKKLQKNLDREAPGHGWHSSSYHKFFHDYAEYEALDEKGRTRIKRVYIGKWYEQDLTKQQKILLRVRLFLLWLAAAGIFAGAATRELGANNVWYVALFQFLCVFCIAWNLIAQVNYLLAPARMTVGDYESSVKRFKNSSLGCVVCYILTAVMVLLYFFLNTDSMLQHFLCAVCYTVSGLLMLLANRLDANVPYQEIENENKAPDGASIID